MIASQLVYLRHLRIQMKALGLRQIHRCILHRTKRWTWSNSQNSNRRN